MLKDAIRIQGRSARLRDARARLLLEASTADVAVGPVLRNH